MTYRLKYIDDSLEKIVYDCVSNYRDESKKDRIMGYISNLKENEELLEKYFKSNGHLNFIEEYGTLTDLDKVKKDMVGLYDNKFSKKGEPGRKYYNKIKLLSDFCPYCLQNEVKQVDHYFPKAEKPTLSVTPINLVPSCSDCNKAKDTTEGLFNPYFDDVDSEQFLFCNISFTENGIIFDYYSEKPENWESVFYERVENLFTKLNDGHNVLHSYRIFASSNFNSLKRNLVRCSMRGKQDLKETIEDYLMGAKEEIGLNSWKFGMYDGLLNELDSLYNFLLENESITK